MSKKRNDKQSKKWINTIRYGEPEVGKKYYVKTRADGFKLMTWFDANDKCVFGHFRDEEGNCYTVMKSDAWCPVDETVNEKQLKELRRLYNEQFQMSVLEKPEKKILNNGELIVCDTQS